MKRGGYREILLLAMEGSARSMKAAEQVNAILKHGWNRGTSKKPTMTSMHMKPLNYKYTEE